MKQVKWFFNNLENIICTTTMIVTLILLVIQVIMRYVFNNSPSWSEELARMLFIWLVFIGGSYATQNREHIKIESGIKIFPKAIRNYALIFGNVLLIAFAVIIVYHGGIYALDMFANNKISLTMKFNMGFVYGSIPLGFALMIIRLIQAETIPTIKEIAGKGADKP